jgi:regulator of protease activity HflC (stomatin/prohibitin superfamily)
MKGEFCMKITVNENERGFLFKNGSFQKMLMPGTYHVFGQTTIRKAPLDKPLFDTFDRELCNTFRKDPAFLEQITEADIPDDSVAAHLIDGHFAKVLPPDHYLYWNVGVKHTFQIFSIAQPETQDVPGHLCDQFCSAKYMNMFLVKPFQVGFLLFDGQFKRVLPPGKYYFWDSPLVEVNFYRCDTRWQELELSGQEILTKDRVGIRVNFVCRYRYTDPLKAFEASVDCDEQFRTAVQLGLREFIAGLTLDELLNTRDTVGEAILEHLQPKAVPLFIEVSDSGVRDIILPGDVRDIMNTVLIAEKKAQANVITRREEVASTRSLLNTAKLMEENKTLYKLKELEYLERICENVGNLSVSGGDVISQLRELVGGRDQN